LVRHRDGVERTLLTAIASGVDSANIAGLLLTAVTDRCFADGGHALDFINKALECLELIGWDHAAQVVPTAAEQLVRARGAEETNAWRHPIDLVPLLDAAFAHLPRHLAEAATSHTRWENHGPLAREILADDPADIINAVGAAIALGAKPTDLTRALAYAAALRVARFGTSNEHSDWDTAHHCFTYCNALHQLLKRALGGGLESSAEMDPVLLRGIFHGCMAVYLTRFLNIPPARIPGEDNDALGDLPVEAETILTAFLGALDRQGAVDIAARLVARYLVLGHPAEPLIATLAQAVLREDADFHTYQMLEAGIRQYREWQGGAEGRHILIAVARYLAAHFPTERSQLQTAIVARRLSRGESLYGSEGERETEAN
jgi:hypothetical protein